MNKKHLLFVNAMFIAVLGMLFCEKLLAATYINYTRLILSEKDREVTFTIRNEGDKPVLMQLWTDHDNLLDRPEDIKMPFLILPPVFRVERNSSRVVRLQLLADKSSLPSNKESLFWLNVLEVPQKMNKGETNALKIAFRTRIKVFYRPAAIKMTEMNAAVRDLRITKGYCTGKPCLQLQNISPLHITLTDIQLSSGRVIKALPADGMIPPFETLEVPLDSATDNEAKAFSWIDDYGVINLYEK